MKKLFKNKKLLITGGTGSFGQQMLNSLLAFDLNEIRIFSRDEKKQFDSREKFKKYDNISYYIGDVRDENSIIQASKNIDFIFHAAALKQVPSCEFFPMEAVKTNIIGTFNLINAAKKNNVTKTVVLSTDKSVYPINAMGQSKALMEKLMIAESRNSENIFCATRYGNVIGSRGSVIPLFYKQLIEKNFKCLTITNPNMTRFMMSLEDSVELVLHAFANGRSGDIFVKKQPAAKIIDIAHAMIDYYQITKPIKNIGIRHGEKIHETLISHEESMRTLNYKNFFVIKPDNRELNYKNFFDKGSAKIENKFEYTSSNTHQLDVNNIIKILSKIKNYESN